MINKLKSFTDIDPALPGAPTEASNGLKFAIAKKADIASTIRVKLAAARGTLARARR